MFEPRGGFTAYWWAGAGTIVALLTCIISGNVAVLVALRRTNRAPAHYPLASLAAADLFVGLVVVPLAACRDLFVFQLHWLVCTCWEALDVFCSTASILSLCSLGWERYCGITAPLAKAKRAKQAKLLAILVWPISFLVALPVGFIYGPKHPQKTDIACPDNLNVLYVFVSSILSFFLPGSVMLILYTRILCALSIPPQIRSHRGQSPRPPMSPIGGLAAAAVSRCNTPLSKTQEPHQSPTLLTPKGGKLSLPAGSKQIHCEVPKKLTAAVIKTTRSAIVPRQRRATRTIVRLMALFLACWTPFFVTQTVDSLCSCVDDSIWQWFTWLGYTNSALNPFVYAAASPSVRLAMQRFSSSSRPSDMQMTQNGRL